MAYSWKNGILGGVSVAENATAGTPLATLVAQDGGVVDAFYYTLSGGDSSLFNIDLYGRLSLKQAIDYDTTGGTSWWRTADGQWHAPDHRYTVVVNAFNDANQIQATTTFILTMGDVNEAPVFQWQLQPFWSPNSSGSGWNNWNAASNTMFLNLAENITASGLQVAKFVAVDPDLMTPSNVTYDLVGTDAGYFSINSNGALILKSRLDYEDGVHTAKNYSVVVKAASTDGGSLASSNLVVISLGNVDDNATVWNGIPATGVAVNETAGITNTVVRPSVESVADFRAVDADGQTVKYSLGGADSWMFSIDSNGVLYRTNNVDYETSTSWRPSHQFSVTVWAWGAANTGGIARDGASISKLFILTINNVDELGTGFTWAQQPIGVNQWRNAASGLITVNISENNALGMAVGQFAATDGDGVAVTYNLSGADAAYFSINNNGALTLKSSLNYEDSVHTAKNYSVVVTAKSTDASVAISSLFVLSLQDNAKEFVWINNPTGASISETAALVGATVADFNIAALDNGPVFAEGVNSSYSLMSGDTWAFSINKQTGVLMLSQPRDYESENSWRPDHRFSVVVGAWRDGGGTISQLFILTINNVNEFGTGFTWAQQPIGTNQWRNGASGLVTVGVNENNAIGMAVGQFAATDGDQVAVTYNLGGTDAAYFSINNNGALTLKSSLDYEDGVHTAKNYSVVVTATSTDGSPAVSSLFVVSLGNVDDNATVWSGTPVTGVAVNETAGITNTVVLSTRVSLADFRAIDGDGQTVKYSLAGDTAGMFSIDSNGVLYRTRNVDYETSQHQFSVTVWAWGAANTGGIANDGAGINKLFILTINNVNEFGTGFTWAQQPIGTNQWRNGASGLVTVGVNENNAMGMAVGQFAATDGDQVAVTYNLGGTDAAYFSINNNGALTLKSSLDYESTHVGKNYSVVVTATSTDGSPAVSSLFVVSLGNVDDNATVWSGTPATGVAVNETAGITNTVVLSTRVSLADFRAIDGDGQTVKYSLAGDTAGMFSIDSNGVLYRTRNVDYETSQHQFSVTVWAWGAANTDGIANDGAGINKLFILTINNVNELGTGFTWAQQPIGVNQWRNGASGLVTVGVNENNAIGMAVGQFAATDGDQVAVTYNLGGTDAAYFSINNNGALTLKSSLDYESTHVGKNYSVVVTATSTDGSPAVSSLFVVSLQDNNKEFGWTGAVPAAISLGETAAVAGLSLADFNISAVDGSVSFGEGVNSGYWLTGADAGNFNIDAKTGVLRLTYGRDYESDHINLGGKHLFTAIVNAWRLGGADISQAFVLTVGNVNDNATLFQWQLQPFWSPNSTGTGWNNWNGASNTMFLNLGENITTAGTQMAKFRAVDADIDALVTYELGGTDATYFSIDTNGRLYLASNLNYENTTHAAKNYSVVVKAASIDGSPAISNLVVVSLGNMDDNLTAWKATPPTGIAIDEKTGIAASQALTTAVSIGDFGATDADGQVLNYWMSAPNSDSWIFSLDQRGVLYRKVDFDYDTMGWRANRQFSVVVGVYGSPGNGVTGSGNNISQLFILTINAVDETPVWSTTPLSSKLLVEDDGATYNYTDAFTLPVSVAARNFTDTNPANNITNYANGAIVTLPFDVVVSPPASSHRIYYRVAGDNTLYEGGMGSSVTLAKGTKLTAFQAGVIVTLNGVQYFQAAASSFVVPLNDSRRLNIPGGILATFAAWDPEGAVVQYSVSGTDASRFIIDGNGKLIFAQSLDFEAAGGANYSVVVVATDNTGHAITQNFVVSFNNTNDEFAWSGTQVAGVSLLELTGTQVVTARAVATFTALDTDINGGGYTPHSGAGFVSYSLAGADITYFTINKDTGVLSFVSAVDGENGHGQLYSITISANEINQTLGTAWVSQNFVLTIGDVDESPIAWQDSNSHPATGVVVESYASLQRIPQGAVYPIDLVCPVSPFQFLYGADVGTPYSIDLPQYANGYSVTLPFDVVIAGDYAQGNTIRLLVKNSDGSITLRGSVADVNTADAYRYTVAAGSVIVGMGVYESSVNGAYTQIAQIPEVRVSSTERRRVTLAGGIVALAPTDAAQNFLFTATDSDVSNIVYSVSGTEAANFTVASDVGGKEGIGKLTYVGSLDYETTSHTHTVTVVATSGNNSVTQLFILSVTGLNDEAAVWTSSIANRAISENNIAGVSIANFLATDPDGAGVTYSLTGTDANLFSMGSNGDLHVISALDYEGTYNGHNGQVFSVVVHAWGTGGGNAIGFGAQATTKLFVLSLGNVAGANHADHTAYIDGTTAVHAVNVGGIIGHDDAGNIDYANVQFHGVNYTDKVITRNVAPDGLQSTTVDYVVRGISDLESLRISFNGFTDTDGSKRNHWFFVQDDAADNSGHIVFDADGQNVNLHSFVDGVGVTNDQINLLAGSNYGIDGDFTKPTDLNLNLASDPLHQNIAGALTFDQFLALIGGSQHISFV